MKRMIAIFIPLLVLIGVSGLITVLEAQQAPLWQVELDNYINQHRSPQEIIEIHTVVRATRPWNYDASMGIPTSNEWPWGIEEIPYPPTKLRCVILERTNNRDGQSSEQQIIYIGYHDDNVWRSGWLLYEGYHGLNSPELANNLNSVGCNLKTE